MAVSGDLMMMGCHTKDGIALLEKLYHPGLASSWFSSHCTARHGAAQGAKHFFLLVTRGAKSTGWPYTATKRT
jgi:hypothetical protein